MRQLGAAAAAAAATAPPVSRPSLRHSPRQQVARVRVTVHKPVLEDHRLPAAAPRRSQSCRACALSAPHRRRRRESSRQQRRHLCRLDAGREQRGGVVELGACRVARVIGVDGRGTLLREGVSLT